VEYKPNREITKQCKEDRKKTRKMVEQEKSHSILNKIKMKLMRKANSW
jgi:hypothetical protein